MISAKMTAVQPVSPPGMSCHRYLWTSIVEAGQDQNWETAALTSEKEKKGWMTAAIFQHLIVILIVSTANVS